MVHVRTISLVFLAVWLGVPFHFAEAKTKCQQAIPRSNWNARPATYVVAPDYTPDVVVIHHANYRGNCTNFDSCADAMRQIQEKDMLKNNSDIIYNFCIGTDYKVYEGRGWGRTGNHAKNLNNRSIGVCIIGDAKAFSPMMENSLITFLRCAQKRKSLYVHYRVIGHRQVGQTKCPGNRIYELISNWPQFENNMTNLNYFLSHPPKLFNPSKAPLTQTSFFYYD